MAALARQRRTGSLGCAVAVAAAGSSNAMHVGSWMMASISLGGKLVAAACQETLNAVGQFPFPILQGDDPYPEWVGTSKSGAADLRVSRKSLMLIVRCFCMIARSVFGIRMSALLSYTEGAWRPSEFHGCTTRHCRQCCQARAQRLIVPT